jgi:hypothetical protein
MRDVSVPLSSNAVAIFTVVGLAYIAWLSTRANARIRAARRALFDQAKSVVDDAELSFGADDLPRLSGRHRGRKVLADLIPDTMTIRRLPQLWLSVTLLDKMPGVRGFTMVVRYAGTEFYSLINSFTEQLDAPAGFPGEILIRGTDATAQADLNALAAPLAAILADPRVKEIAVTTNGLRIVRQAAEGRKGEHLLLRQAMFDDADVPAADLQHILLSLDQLSAAIQPLVKARAA